MQLYITPINTIIMSRKKLFIHSKKPQHKIKSLKPKANKGKAMKLSTVTDCFLLSKHAKETKHMQQKQA